MVNNDPRYLAARDVLNDADEYLPTKLHKVARAGATTGITANCIDSMLVPLLIAPTKKISHETIRESVEYSQHPEANIKVLLSNHECLLNKRMIDKHPDVGRLPILPLPKKCSGCNLFETCRVTELIRTPPEDVDGIGITYQKLQAIMFSDSDIANMIKQRLVACDVIIFDEAHVFESPDTMSIQVYPYQTLAPYQTLFKDNNKISPFLETFAKLVHEKETSIMQLVHEHDNAEKNLLSITLEDSVDAMDFKKVVGAIKEIIKIMKDRDKYNLSVEDVLYISNIVMVFAADEHVLHYIKNEEGGTVYLSTTDSLLPAIRIFKSMIDPSLKKKIIFTTATFGDFDYTSVFGFHSDMLMPDVMKSNRRMIIYPDTIKMDDINYRAQHWDRIVNAACEYEKKYPGITFVCMKKNVAFWLQNRLAEQDMDINIDWYRSDKMIGAASNERRCVCVGAPVAPINVYDGVSATYKESQKKRIGDNHAAFWQAISRFKSPSGSQDSHIFCIGITQHVIEQMIVWGTSRKLSINDTKCIGVDVDVAFDQPSVVDGKIEKVRGMTKNKKEITRRMIMRKFHMNRDDAQKFIQSLVDTGELFAKTPKNKRKSVVYVAKL